MGARELLAALRGDGERKAAQIREEAGAAAARLREEAAERIARLRETRRSERARAIAEGESAILAEAARTARRLRLSGQERLTERLYESARRLLCRLRTADYPDLFGRLTAELPPASWDEVRVNPADAALAAALFPGARIVADDAVCGGMEACSSGGRVRVDNTLEKRLARGWPELLPRLLGEIDQSD